MLENKDIERALELIEAKYSYREYFFKRISSAWLKPLKKRGCFSNPPEPISEGGCTSFPLWPESRYLVRIAAKKPEEVMEIIEKIKPTGNFRVHTDYTLAAANMPSAVAKRIVPLASPWVKSRDTIYSLLPYKLADLVIKLYEDEETDAALDLASTILDVTIDRPVDSQREKEFIDLKPTVKSYFHSWDYRKIVKKIVARLKKGCPLRLLVILSEKLSKAIYLENKVRAIAERNYDCSYIWQSAVEEHEQNRYADNPKNSLVFAIRDLIADLGKENNKMLSRGLEILGKYEYPIFRRLELHTFRLFPEFCVDRIIKVFSCKELFHNTQFFHEYVLLLESQFPGLPVETQKLILKWIEEGPETKLDLNSSKNQSNRGLMPGRIERRRELWQFRRLRPLRDFLEGDWKKRYHGLTAKFSEPEHYDFEIYSSSWVGPVSPIGKEKLRRMSPDDFIDYIVKDFRDFRSVEVGLAPSPEGLARLLSDVVKENPAPYAEIAERFLDERIFPAYLSGLLSGLELALVAGSNFAVEPVISLCEAIIKRPESVDKDSRDAFDFGKLAWVRGSVAGFIGELMRRDTYSVSENVMSRSKAIIFHIIKSDEDPTEESEKKYGPPNMDFITHAINCNRGKAMHALMEYCLRFARMSVNKTTSNKEDLPIAERRLQPDVASFLEKRLQVEQSPSVHSMFGRYLPHMYCYLDREWVEKRLQEHLIFPDQEEKTDIWKGHWQGFIAFSEFNDKLFAFLKDHYSKAINLLKYPYAGNREGTEQYDRRLAEHLMISYWREYEDIAPKASLVNQFFKNAPVDLRLHAITFLGITIPKANEDSKKWDRLRMLWQSRVNAVKDKELAGFTEWLKYRLPESIDSLLKPIQSMIPYLGESYRLDDFLEYLEKNARDFPDATLSLLLKLLDEPPNIHFLEGSIRNILVRIPKTKDLTILVNKAVDKMCLLGYYDFRDLIVNET